MNKKAVSMLSVLAVAALILSGIPMAASESEADSSDEYYGTVLGLSLDDIDKVIKSIFHESIEEIIEGYASEYGYQLKLVPDFQSKTAVTRTISTENGLKYITDRVTGYFVVTADIDCTGKFPAAGTYTVNDGESVEDFLKRVFVDNVSSTERHVDYTLLAGITLDIGLITEIDTKTGEVKRAYLALLPLLYIEGNGNVEISVETDSTGEELKSLTIAYGDKGFQENVYTDLQMEFDVEGLKLIGDSVWQSTPTVTMKVITSIVSTDLIQELWPFISEAIDKSGKMSAAVPELLKKILTSTDKKLDVRGTIESLTGSKIPDMMFKADMTVTNYQDLSGNEYAGIEIQRPGEPVSIDYSLGNYSVDIYEIMENIPDDVISPSTKLLVGLALGVLGWDTMELADVSGDQKAQKEISEIQAEVNNINIENEKYETNIPTEYVAIAIAVIVISCLVAILMWRGRI